jgi:leucyl aminopeptidase
VWPEQAAQQLGGDAYADADQDEEKNGEIIFEVHDEACLNDRLMKLLHACSAVSRNPGLVPCHQDHTPKDPGSFSRIFGDPRKKASLGRAEAL